MRTPFSSRAVWGKNWGVCWEESGSADFCFKPQGSPGCPSASQWLRSDLHRSPCQFNCLPFREHTTLPNYTTPLFSTRLPELHRFSDHSPRGRPARNWSAWMWLLGFFSKRMMRVFVDMLWHALQLGCHSGVLGPGIRATGCNSSPCLCECPAGQQKRRSYGRFWIQKALQRLWASPTCGWRYPFLPGCSQENCTGSPVWSLWVCGSEAFWERQLDLSRLQ